MKKRWGWVAGWVGGAFGLALLLDLFWSRAGECAHVLSYVALVGVSFLASWAAVIAAVNLLLGVALFLWPQTTLVIALNRHAAQAEALFTWTTFAVIVWPHFYVQFPLLAAVIFGGPLLVDEAARRELRWRRLSFYGFTIVGLVALNSLALRQWRTLLPLEAAIGVGLAMRALASGLRRHGEGAPTPRWDRLAIGAGLAAAIAAPLLILRPAPACPQQPLDAWNAATQARGPVQTDVALFLLADTQLHELDGQRSAGHLDIVDRFVSVAVRPVELDLLSGITFRHFVDLYARLRIQYPEMRWAHLGDFADLGCRGEVARFEHLLEPIPRALLAGAAIGNHDGTFVGNFAWHPDWDTACPSGRLDRYNKHTGKLWRILRPLLAIDARPRTLLEERPLSTLGLLPRVALPSIAPLGSSGGRRILGAFLDTSDYAGLSIGAAGKQGEVSSAQREWLLAEVENDRDAAFVIFMHHPIDETTRGTRDFLGVLAERLGDRLLAIISAHRHQVEHHTPCLGGRVVDELLIGSTIDPPQQAALLEIGPDRGLHTMLRVRSIPAIGLLADVTAGDCRAAVRELRKRSECAELLANQEPTPESAEAHPRNPAQVKAAQQERARRLLACVCRDAACTPTAQPLDDPDVFAKLESLLPARKNELVCLSWAASVLQARKHEPGWSYARALAESFDDTDRTAVMLAGAHTDIQCKP